MTLKRKFTRRHFFGTTALASAGAWFSLTDFAGARFVRQALQETTRAISPPKHKPTPGLWSDNEVNVAWLGHATVLVNFYGVTILTDPVFMPRIGAGIGFATVGPKRLVAPPLTMSELPPIDLLLLSHAHMDHFDTPTLRRFHAGPKTISAKDTRDLYNGMTIRKDVSELAWGESSRIETAAGDMRVEAFEVKHWGSRWRHDRKRGYNGYVLERGGKKLMFGGDTAMTDKFKDIRGKGPFDLAIMPIGSYKPFKKNHCDPEESVAMTNYAGAERLLPVHFKTFRLGEEGTVEPLERLEAAIGSDRIALRDIGETVTVA